MTAIMVNKIHEKTKYFFIKVSLINLERRSANIEYSKIVNIYAEMPIGFSLPLSVVLMEK